MKRLQGLPTGSRLVIFIFILVGGVLLLGGLTVGLLLLTLNSSPRQTAQALVDGVTVAEFAALSDDDAYPSTVEAGADGTVYTASYASGAVWAISADGASVSEIPNARDRFDSVTALAARPDGTLLVVAFTGGEDGAWAIHTLTPAGDIAEFGRPDDSRGFVSPFDIALDADGGVYVVDRSRADIWRWDADGGSPDLWWSLLTAPDGAPTADPASRSAPTGLAYDPAADALLVADTDTNTIVRIPRSRESSEVVYRYGDGETRFPPGFDGIAVAADGTIYVTALDQKGVAMLSGQPPYAPDSLTYVAGNFRGPSDLAFLPDGRLIVANFDSLALVQPGVRPQLPFALDVIAFAPN